MNRQIVRTVCIAIMLVFAAAQPISTHAGQNPFDVVKEAARKAKEELKRRAQEAAQNAAGQVPTPNPAPAPNQPAPAANQPSPQGSADAPSVRPSGNAPASRTTATSAAKIDVQIVAPNEQGMSYYISPKGAHIVAITQKGTRWVVLRDGVPGPVFDQLIPAAAPSGGGMIIFSPDGTRFGYIGRQGQEWVLMIDGKEVLRRPIGTGLNANSFDTRFTTNSKHWLFHHVYMNERINEGVVYWDGVTGPVGALDNTSITVSADGERYAYTVTKPGTTQQVLVVDGKPAPALGFTPVFTGDGRHLYTKRITRPTVGAQVTELLLDGRPILRATLADVYTAPVGLLAVIRVGHQQPNSIVTSFLHANGAKVPGSDGPNMSAMPVQFSDDGKHWVMKYGHPGVPNYLIVDGVRQREYASIGDVRFTDTGKPVYVVGSGQKSFVIVGDQESENGYIGGLFPISLGKGGRVGYAPSLNQQTMAVVVDGKVTAMPARMWPIEFSFSPDGQRIGYAVTAAGGNGPGTVMVDHQPQSASSTKAFPAIQKNYPTQYVWSPDSKYTMHYGSPGTRGYTSQFAIFLGNRAVAHGSNQWIQQPTFTPDSKHLFWIAMAPNNEDMQVFLDGTVVFEFDDQGRGPLNDTGNWQMDADGTLTFIVQTVEGFKRVRVTPGPENGIETMLARGKVVRS